MSELDDWSEMTNEPDPPERVGVEAEIRRETEKAFLLFDGDREAWVPKSMVKQREPGIFEMPEWLAMDREFI